MRLTPEQEQEIREYNRLHDYPKNAPYFIISVLLAEIDALRVELQTSLTMTEVHMKMARENSASKK
jgi:hypothetical protein